MTIPISRALISPCGKHRYDLQRDFSHGPRTVLFLMLNPSTADAVVDDPTIRRCCGYAKAWGFDRLIVGNLYSYRATDPKDLPKVGSRGDSWEFITGQQIQMADLVVCAWGTNADKTDSEDMHRTIIGLGKVPHYLRLTKNGFPSHPLYLPKDLEPTPWRASV